MKTRFAGYKSTLKDLDDILDLMFNRFPAYLVVRAAAPLKITPNALTAASFLLTCVSAWLLAQDKTEWAALFIYLKVVFDCSDGQMARFTGTTTRYGRIYDELADISGQFLIFGGIGYAMMKTGFEWIVFLALAASLFFMGANITIVQNFRSLYVRIYERRGRQAGRTGRAFFLAIDGLDSLREATLRLVSLPDINAYAEKNGWTGGELEGLRAAFRLRFRPMVYLFSLVAGTSHLLAIALLALVQRLAWIFPLFILWYNVVLAMMVVVQIAKVTAFERRYMSSN